MQRFVRFIRTTAIGGLLVIVPIAIVLFVLAQVFYGLYGAAAAIAEIPAVQDLDIGLSDAAVLAGITLAALIGACFLTGLIVRTRLGQAVKNWMSQNVARRIPMYTALSNLTKRVAGVEGTQFTPIEVDLYGSEARAIGFLVEEFADGRAAVFLPSAPVATIGTLHVVPKSAIRVLAASVADTASVLTQWGVDAHLLYEVPASKEPGPDENPAAS
jgi:uncharacterized membrane protein